MQPHSRLRLPVASEPHICRDGQGGIMDFALHKVFLEGENRGYEGVTDLSDQIKALEAKNK